MNRDQLIQAYGFTAVPRSTTALLATRSNPSAPPTVLTPDDISVIHSWLTANERLVAINAYAKDKLPEPTYNHSLRVYLYGLAIARDHFPAWLRGREVKSTYLLSCLLHDIGTTDENINSTLMSFEFQGGLIALDLLREKGFEREQAEGVAETVIRHQDLGETGTVTTVTALILLGTIFGKRVPLLFPS
jgi:cyanamide hydratase